MNHRIILWLTILLLVGCSTSYAQYDRVSFRTDLSLNLSRGDYKLTSSTLQSKTLVGYRLYAGVDIPIKNYFFINPGVALQLKGANVPVTDLQLGDGSALQKNLLQSRFVNLVIPVNLGYHLPLTEAIALSLYTGPYFSAAMSKTIRLKLVDGSLSYYEDSLKQLINSELTGWDMGWSASSILGFGLFYVTAGVDFGFINTIKRSDVEATMRNVSYYFGAGVRL